MRFRILLITAVLSATVSLVAAAGQFASGIVYGKGGAFFLEAPQGWVLDNESGAKQNLHAVFYPKGSTWKDSKVVMYAFSVLKSDPRYPSVEKAMAYDKTQVQQHKPETKIQSGNTLKTKQGKAVSTLRFLGNQFDRFEASAYVDNENSIDRLIVSADSEMALKNSMDAFNYLVTSYLLMDAATVP